MIKAFFLHPLVLSLLIGVLVFIFCYVHFPRVIRFFKEKTFHSQREILKIADQMMLQAGPEKITFWLWMLGLSIGFLVFLISWPYIVLGLVLGIFGFLFSWLAVQRIMKTMWETRSNQIVFQMVDGLSLMTNAMKVGLGITQAMERVIKGGKRGPLVQEFQLILNKVRLGMSVEEALNEMGERVDRPDVDMMITGVNILKETGGNIAETFSVIADTIRERQKVENKIKAITAQATMQATIVSAIPFVILVMMFFLNKQYAILMLTTPLGWFCLFIILTLIILGGIMMKKTVAIKI